MIEVTQPTSDSCLKACIASVLEVDVALLPDVDHSLPGPGWLDRYNELLMPWGLRVETFLPFRFDGVWIAEVLSKREDAPGNHVVVMRGLELAWDPALGDKYERVDPADVLMTMLLVPVDLAAWAGPRP